ncbi:MAG: phosphodiesterase [Alphaproteobacteria bacterium]|nr:phosphodiesterase [Alphaproteobacteria bacterium]
MLIAQLSDLHIVAPDQLWKGRVDTAGMLRTAIHAVMELPQRPDMVLLTGDLVEHGAPEEYAHLASLLAPLPMPVHAIVGNHDDRAALRQHLSGIVPLSWDGDYRGVVEGWPLRLVLVDSVAEGQSAGVLGSDRLAWIDARLTEDRRPTLVALHHPPFVTGIGGFDLPEEDIRRFTVLMERHPHVERVLCGHLHRPIVARVGRTMAMTVPSTAHQVAPILGAPPQWWLEPPGYALHWWTGTQLISHILPVNRPTDGPFPFKG